MSHVPRTPRAVEQRRALGRRLRAHRLALGLGVRDVAAHVGTGKVQMTAIENATADVVTGTLIDVAAAVGLEVGLVASYHLPLLDLTADEIKALTAAAEAWHDVHPYATVRSALDKLTKENPDAN